jgi:isoquinoline 1-oxidoreductase beta subunit
MTTDGCVSRRDVLRAAAAGSVALTVGFRLAPAAAAGSPAASGPGAAPTPVALRPDAWLRIEPDGTVHVVLTKTEFGQGATTGIAMVVAEELDADWARVDVEIQVPDGRRSMGTGGSTSLSSTWTPARTAAAQAREMLRAAAAATWGVPPAECRTRAHAVVHEASGRRLAYGDLVEAAATEAVPATPTLKPATDYTLVGRPVHAKPLPDILRGAAVYGLDVRVPGMLVAVIERSPTIGGRIATIDDAAARRVPGVVAIVPVRGTPFPAFPYVRDGVAVVARGTWAALQGRQALRVTWNEQGSDRRADAGALASSGTLEQDFVRALDPATPADARQGLHPRVTALRRGTEAGLDAAFAAAHRTVDLTLDVPLQPHAPMEPMNAVAHWTPGRLEVWAPCHCQSDLLHALRERSGLPAERVVIHTPLIGGSFGRRLEPDFAVEAALVAREVNRPVQLVWTREDDFRFGLFGPPSRHRIRAALDAEGRLLAVDHAVAALSVLRQIEPGSVAFGAVDDSVVFDAIKFPYDVGELHVSQRLVDQAIRVLWWRRGFTPNNTFANEVLLDACARAAGADPLAWRQARLLPAHATTFGPPDDSETVDTGRLARVQRLACEAAGWDAPRAAGTGLGLASTVTETYVAQVAEVAAAPGGGAPRVRRVVTAVDCGRVVNPQLVRAQVEGSVVFALTAALKGRATVEAGRVQQGNFHEYPLLRIDEMPLVETVLVESDAPPTGIGEPASHPTAAAVSNAVFEATGRRLTRLPFDLAGA